MRHSRAGLGLSQLNRPLIAILVLLLLAGACGDSDGGETVGTATEPASTPTEANGEIASVDEPRVEPPAGAQTADLVAGVNRFAFDLYRAVAEEESGNLIHSPYSIALAFSMVYAGARGDTEAQIADVLGFLPQEEQHPAANALERHLTGLGSEAPPPGQEQGEPFRLAIANAVWGQRGYSFEEPFLRTLVAHYGAGIRIVDFQAETEAAIQAINDWISDQTEGRISDAVSPDVVTPDTRLVLANAIYFKAAWLFPFDEDATEDAAFTLLDGSEVTVPMMRQQPVRVPYVEGDGYQAVALPYTGETVEMLLVVPDEGRFEEIEAGLSSEFIEEARSAAELRDVTLAMPRFDFESDLDLKPLLSGIGMPDPFGPADFSGISAGGDLFIAAAVHRATITVNEIGTEATAATVIAMEESALETAELTVDRPFIFAIVDRETGALLFLGRVMNPAG